ncbi:hypothetical protein ZIOFF_002565 [Zingiber officinale]|uniref:Uncharacterized protein n=1 Tax=Zingiber officinale TaxID=94328 RepID=A0A8J5I5B6_ZINOF|nr:hypothetical protein ZIOFF_002565 [Zingiber officinale]
MVARAATQTTIESVLAGTMSRQKHDDLVLCSSIALLQERFRRLQQIKLMREERQILRVLAEGARQRKWFLHGDRILHFRPPCGSLSLQMEYHFNYSEFPPPAETSFTRGLRSNTNNMHASTTKSNETERGSNVAWHARN